MRQSIGRISSAILELLLPSATAQGCAYYCQVNSARTKHRCCRICPPVGIICAPYVSPGSCNGVVCP
jgi:hypothetical protein